MGGLYATVLLGVNIHKYTVCRGYGKCLKRKNLEDM